ncbi:hypothetical protein Ocin01_04815 [Orchesella cincta]|uniref:Chitin-binding type-2 domain-containing protein n=1 Tax=Orchesella cincta TaxID=48709 RepID=A0A1D2N9F2_ORCCI|nr:hypothetical protein Ocin01_04815 [Orchesella cincta]
MSQRIVGTITLIFATGLACSVEFTKVDFECKSPGKFPHNNSNYYYECYYIGNGNFTVFKHSCPELNCFDAMELACNIVSCESEMTSERPVEPFSCPGPGKFRHPDKSRNVFLCTNLLQVALAFKRNSGETPNPKNKKPSSPPGKKGSSIRGRSFAPAPSKEPDDSSSNSAPPPSYCKAEGITAHEDERKYNYCFMMGSSDLIHQVTDCPIGTCFDSSTSCCSRKACKNQGTPKPRPGGKPKSQESSGEESKPHKKPDFVLWSADENPTSAESDLASAEMAFFYSAFRERKQKVCKGGVHCTRSGAFPSNNDRYSYYVCSRQPKSRDFIARHFNCPRRRCFKGKRCSRC